MWIQFNEIPPHVEYSATESAKDLKEIFPTMWVWGEKHISESMQSKQGEKV
ncbi:MAG: winged helix-turn-helix transcriptional regulator [Ruminococcus sp.]|nr:winged helix-turn-helix transcriptional regulator [Ruminococcus sp.]